MKRRAFTLLEVMVVVGIIVILASLTMPALQRAKLSAKVTATKGNLRQIYIGLMLYREQNDPVTEYGTAVEMGLPWLMEAPATARSIVPTEAVWRSPCCCHKDGPGPGRSGDYSKYYTDYASYFDGYADELWTPYVRRVEGGAVLLADLHCNDPELDLYRPISPICLVGVRLNGRIEARHRTMSAASYQRFWHSEDQWPPTKKFLYQQRPTSLGGDQP